MVEMLYTLFTLIIFSSHPVEMAFRFTHLPNNPSYALQGSNASLVWGYSVDDRQNELAGIIWYVYDKAAGKFLGARVENKDGTRVPHSDVPDAYKGRLHIIGNATLVITNVTFQDSTRFWCSLVSDSAQLQDVNNITELIVAELPKASVDSKVITCNMGDSTRVTCNATGTPVPQFVWFRRGTSKPLVSGDKYNIVTAERSSDLTIKNCSIEDEGYYSCKTSIGPLEPSEVNIYLGIVSLIKSDESCPSTNQDAFRGLPTTLCCPVSGFPTPEVTWKFPDGNVKKTGNTILPITPQREDFGTYTCSAEGLKETDPDPVIVSIELKEKGKQTRITAMDNQPLGKGDKFKWDIIWGALDYIVRINGSHIYPVSLHGGNKNGDSDNKTGIEIPYSTLNFTDPGNKPPNVRVYIEILAIDQSGVIGKGGPYTVDITSAATTHELSFIFGIVLVMLVFTL